MALDPLDSEIMEFFKEVYPSGAYILGFNEYAGKLFVASTMRSADPSLEVWMSVTI